MPKGKILSVEDGGSIWRILYMPEEGGIDHVIFDWRMFSNFYEGVSGRSFYQDYNFGYGRDIIKKYFKGKTLIVDGEEFEESVSLED
jgi:hypothetical protein